MNVLKIRIFHTKTVDFSVHITQNVSLTANTSILARLHTLETMEDLFSNIYETQRYDTTFNCLNAYSLSICLLIA